jgi:hypothetical protein
VSFVFFAQLFFVFKEALEACEQLSPAYGLCSDEEGKFCFCVKKDLEERTMLF